MVRHMTIRHLLGAALLAVMATPATAEFRSPWRIDDARYEQGDCITATDQTLSFYGHYARVEGIASFSGTAEPGVYILSFPVFVARTPLHAKAIESRTQRVDDDFCARQPAANPPS